MRPRYFVVPFFLLILASFVFIIPFKTASGIPAFARKYETSCATCHAAYPELNAFGDTFRRLGYHFPAGQDLQMVKEKPISMGAPAYKKVWPNAIWPGDIPASSPIALILESEITIGSEADNTNVDFSHMMGEMELLAGGTIGDNINFLSAVEIGEDGVEIEMGSLGIYNLLPDALFNLRIGQFPPEVLFVTNHRRFGPEYWITSRMVGDNQWSLEASQKGFEANGMFGEGQFSYNLGLVEGRGNIQNNAKDIYLHLTYKFGGLPYNGVSDSDVTGQQGWGGNSLQLGGFSYFGNAELSNNQENMFRMFGGDLQINHKGFKGNAGAAFRKDEQPYVESNTDVSTQTWFIEGYYFVYPWLIPGIRYETFMLDPGNNGSVTDSRILPGIQILMRANLRAFIQLEIEQENGEDLELGETELGLQLGF